jgi:hypothetical protein
MQFEASGSSVEPYPSERLHHLWNGLFLKPKNIDVKITQPTLFARRESNGDVPELLSKMAARKDLLIQRLKKVQSISVVSLCSQQTRILLLAFRNGQ